MINPLRSEAEAFRFVLGSLAYFGFYREGCICPIGSIQNVAVALTDPKYSIPIVVTATPKPRYVRRICRHRRPRGS